MKPDDIDIWAWEEARYWVAGREGVINSERGITLIAHILMVAEQRGREAQREEDARIKEEPK